MYHIIRIFLLKVLAVRKQIARRTQVYEHNIEEYTTSHIIYGLHKKLKIVQ